MKLRIQHYRAPRTELHEEISEPILAGYLSDVGSGFTSAGEGAWLDGRVLCSGDRFTIEGELRLRYRFLCARCAAECERQSALWLHWILMPLASLGKGQLRENEEIELATEDLETSFYEGDEIELGELIREAVILELDPDAVCGEEACDARLEALLSELSGPESTEFVDPRWSKLADLKGRLKN